MSASSHDAIAIPRARPTTPSEGASATEIATLSATAASAATTGVRVSRAA